MFAPATAIRAHIEKIPKLKIFTTREVLCFGPRNSVDKELSRLVKRKAIVRLTYGVFTKKDESDPFPTPEEIALAKAEAWGKRTMLDEKDAALKLGLIAEGNLCPTFLTDGSTSSFQAIGQCIVLKKRCPKTMLLGDSKIAQVAKALWYFKKHGCSENMILQAVHTLRLSDEDKRALPFITKLIPSWLSDLLVWQPGWA